MDYLGNYRLWKGEPMDGPDAEFAAQLSARNSVAVEERSRMEQECKALQAKIEKLKAYILNTCSLHRDGMKCEECARLGCGIYEIVKGNANA